MASGDTLVEFGPLNNEQPTSNAASFELRNNRPCLDFDGASSEEAVFSAVMPQGYAGGGLTVILHVAGEGVAGDWDWDAEFERVGTVLDVDGDSFAAPQSTDGTSVPGTAGVIEQISIAFTSGGQMDGILVGEGFRLKITRVGGDDANNDDANLFWVEIRET